MAIAEHDFDRLLVDVTVRGRAGFRFDLGCDGGGQGFADSADAVLLEPPVFQAILDCGTLPANRKCSINFLSVPKRSYVVCALCSY